MSSAVPKPPSVEASSWNVLSIISFIAALVGFNIVAVVLGFIGLNQVKKTGQRGRGLALAAVIIGLASVVVIIIVIVGGIIASANGIAVN